MPNRRSVTLWTLLCLAAPLAGCARLNYRPPLDSSTSPDFRKGYLYGRFTLERDFMNQVRLALQLENKASGRVLSLRLRDDRPVYAVEVDPGAYQLKGLVYAPVGAVMDWELTKIALPAEPSYLGRTITVGPGQACYLGDFSGTSRRANFGLLVGPLSFVTWVTFKGGLVGVKQDFSATTEALKRSVPGLATLEFRPAWQGAAE